MSASHRELLKNIRTFPSLVKYLRDELDWPIHTQDFEELTFDYTAEELGIDSKSAAKIQEIKRLRPLSPNQPWGIFFVKFEPKRLPVVALRRILSRVVVKKRASANSAERAAWEAEDLLFVSNYGEGEERKISLAHFTQDRAKNDLPTLKVLGWDNLDTALHLDHVAEELHEKLAWPEDENNTEGWRQTWRSAFTLRHREVITTSKALAMKLAELARDLRARIKSVMAIETDDGTITKLMKAFKEALIHDLDNDSFADMYAQTIAYGLLSARISNPKSDSIDDFEKHFPVTNPFLKELMKTFVSVGDRKGKKKTDKDIDFDEIGVNDVVELLDDANMEAVVHDFGDRNPQEDPVIHFYELFLKEYDAKKRIQRGVFYTPLPVVSFIVRSVDELLRTEFGLEDGFADTTTWSEMAECQEGLEIPAGTMPGEPFIMILDPATGTGTFLVEVIDIIHKTMIEKWKREGHKQKNIDQLWNEYVPKHLLPRLCGFEVMMAPYAIAHVKIGLKLYETGYRFGSDERARIYLTNSLEPQQSFSDRLAFAVPALAHEAEAVNEIKRRQQFTVIIGNPPYAGHSLNIGDWIKELVDVYYQVDGKPLGEKNPKWLQDDYVKFIRFGQELCSRSQAGVFSFITNHGYIDNPSFRGMRQSLLNSFSSMWVMDLHGNTKKKEKSPDGSPDKNVFDIQQGVAIFVATFGATKVYNLLKSDSFGSREKKYEILSKNTVKSLRWETVNPTSPFYLFFPQDEDIRAEYLRYPSIKKIMPVNVLGFQTHRDHFAIAIDRETLVSRIKAFRSADIKDDEIKSRFELSEDRGWNLRNAREKIHEDKDWLNNVICCLYRPFDVRWCYFSTVLMDRPRRELLDHVSHKENLCLLVSRQVGFLPWRHVGVSNIVAESCLVSNKTKEGNYNFPLYLYPERDGLAPTWDVRINFSDGFLRDLAYAIEQAQTAPNSLPEGLTAENILFYIFAVLHSPLYRRRYADFLKTDFPRLPLPTSLEMFRLLSELGSELNALQLMESSRLDEYITTVVGSGEFQVEKVSYSDETVWLDKAKTCGFHGVPEEVWGFYMGCYQVCEKWLKDRQAKGGKNPRPGRLLNEGDITHYQKIVVALNETIRIMKEIDEVIEKHGGWPDAFTSEDN